VVDLGNTHTIRIQPKDMQGMPEPHKLKIAWIECEKFSYTGFDLPILSLVFLTMAFCGFCRTKIDSCLV